MSAIKNISLYIPHVFSNYTRGDVSYQFECLNIGEVKRVDFVSKISKNGEVYNAAYIHFNQWYNTDAARNFQERVINPNEEARIVYDDPWYWIVLENKSQRVNPTDRKKRISLDFTPEKKTCVDSDYIRDLMNAPVKEISHEDFDTYDITPVNLQHVFDEAVGVKEDKNEWMDDLIEYCEKDQEERELDEIEQLMDEDDKYLITIDSRYVKELEEENLRLRYTYLGQYWVR